MKNFFRFFMCLFQFLLMAGFGISQKNESYKAVSPANWAERLGFPTGKRVIIFHADDMGMCEEANKAVISLFEKNEIQSAAAMPPCPAYKEAIEWAKKNRNADVGMHITLNSEMKSPRWGPVAGTKTVPGLVSPEGNLWSSQRDVVIHATREEVEKELRAQIKKTLAMGFRPSHIDTHMGTVYGTDNFLETYLKLAEEYRIPAMVIDNPEVMEGFMKYVSLPAVTERQKELVKNYSLPKLDYFAPVQSGKTYEEKRDKFFELIRSLKPGLIEIIFHPQVKSERSASITAAWQQRVWEAELFSDPIVKQFFRDEGLLFTTWKEIMRRYDKKLAAGN